MLSDAYFEFIAGDISASTLANELTYYLFTEDATYRYTGDIRAWGIYVRQLALVDSPLLPSYVPIAFTHLHEVHNLYNDKYPGLSEADSLAA